MVVSDVGRDPEQGSMLVDAAASALLAVDMSDSVVSSLVNPRLMKIVGKVDL